MANEFILKPWHGYETKTEFEQMVHKQWPLDTGQIYTTIDRLVRDMLAEPVDGEDQDRKPYKITAKGSQELLDWLLQPVELEKMRWTLSKYAQ